MPLIIECADAKPLSCGSPVCSSVSFVERFSFGFPLVRSGLICPGDTCGVTFRFALSVSSVLTSST